MFYLLRPILSRTCRYFFGLCSSNIPRYFLVFIRPSSDGTYYGMVMSVRPSDSASVRPSGSPSAHFPHFSPTCFDLLSWNFAHDFVLPYYRSNSSVVTLRQFLKELCLFVNFEFRLCAVFRTFLLHDLTYWYQILHKTLFHRITDQVRVSSIYINSCGSYAPFGTSNTGNSQFSALFSYMLWHIELKVCIWLCFTVLQIKFEYCEFASIGVGVMLLLELRILKIHCFPHFSLTCFDILNWNFAYDFVSPYYKLSSSVVNLHQFLWELCPFWNLDIYALTYWAEILHMTLLNCTTDQVWEWSICIYFCRSNTPFGT